MKTYKVLLQTRMKLSYYGNPRYRFVLQQDNGIVLEATTKPDYNFVYGLSEHEDFIEAEIRETKSGRMYIYNAKGAKGWSDTNYLENAKMEPMGHSL